MIDNPVGYLFLIYIIWVFIHWCRSQTRQALKDFFLPLGGLMIWAWYFLNFADLFNVGAWGSWGSSVFIVVSLTVFYWYFLSDHKKKGKQDGREKG